MARLCYATELQLAELIRRSGLPDNTPPAKAFRMFAHAPALGAAALKLVFALFTETALDPVLRCGWALHSSLSARSCICGQARGKTGSFRWNGSLSRNGFCQSDSKLSRRDTFRRAGCHADLALHLTRFFREAGLRWPTIKAEVPIGGEPGCYLYTWFAETLRSLLPRIEQFNLASAVELDLDTLVARMETEDLARHSQLIGPLQFGAWTRKS
jgi:hypothetical protein